MWKETFENWLNYYNLESREAQLEDCKCIQSNIDTFIDNCTSYYSEGCEDMLLDDDLENIIIDFRKKYDFWCEKYDLNPVNKKVFDKIFKIKSEELRKYIRFYQTCYDTKNLVSISIGA